MPPASLFDTLFPASPSKKPPTDTLFPASPSKKPPTLETAASLPALALSDDPATLRSFGDLSEVSELLSQVDAHLADPLAHLADAPSSPTRSGFRRKQLPPLGSPASRAASVPPAWAAGGVVVVAAVVARGAPGDDAAHARVAARRRRHDRARRRHRHASTGPTSSTTFGLKDPSLVRAGTAEAWLDDMLCLAENGAPPPPSAPPRSPR